MEKDINNQEFGSLIRSIREQQGFSRIELADLSEINDTYLGRIERGEHAPTLTTILQICRTLNILPSTLFKQLGW